LGPAEGVEVSRRGAWRASKGGGSQSERGLEGFEGRRESERSCSRGLGKEVEVGRVVGARAGGAAGGVSRMLGLVRREPGGDALEALIDALAEALHDADEAREVARRAGFAVGDLPAFDTPGKFWSRVVRAVADEGATTGGVEALVEQAKRRRPGNSFLAAYVPVPTGTTGATATRPSPAALDEYRRIALTRHERLALDGFASKLRLKPLLRQVHVPLRATDQQLDVIERVASREELDPTDDAERWRMHEPRPLDDMFALADRCGTRAVVLLGDPGSGKTTQLEWMLLQLLGGHAKALSLPVGALPVFLPLRELDPRESMTAFVQRMIVGETSDLGQGFAARLLKHDDVVFMLDGLDEVADPERRVAVVRWIDDKHDKDHRPGHRFVVTCRHASYVEEGKLGAAFLELHLSPLGAEEVRELVTRWHGLHCVEHGKVVQPEAGEPSWADTLLEQLSRNKSRHVAAMKGNPLLLTAICMVRAKHPDGTLPDDAESLFRQCTDVLLETWPKRAKQKKVPLDARQARTVLEPVAWCMQRERLDEATTEQLHGAVEDGLGRIRVEGLGLGPGALLESMRDASGLVVGWKPGQYRFVHRGFREYLAALELRSRPGELETVAKGFGDSWWREVIPVMLAARDEALFERFMGLVVQQDGFVEWAGGELMDEVLALGHGAAGAIVDLVKVIRRRAGQAGAREELEALVRRGPAAWVDARRRMEAGGGEVRTKVVHGVELVLVAGGRFLMGSPEGEERRYDDEGPQHEVELGAFWLARTPVTNGQYREYMKANPKVKEPDRWGNRRYNRDEQPVVGVSWEEAKAYCTWARLRLPTEAQWEYACRAGTMTRYCSGDTKEDLKKVGWYVDNSRDRLHAVSQLESNAWGLFDMHGNVYEWCEDTWVDSYEGAIHRPGDGLRVESVSGPNRVIRGGDFGNMARGARSAFRSKYGPNYSFERLGFRPAQGHP